MSPPELSETPVKSRLVMRLDELVIVCGSRSRTSPGKSPIWRLRERRT